MPQRLAIQIEQDTSGWPPVSVESVWGAPVDGDVFKLVSIPFFAGGVAHGDHVRVVHQPGEELPLVSELVEEGGGSTIRIVGLNGHGVDDVVSAFQDLEVDFETLESYGIVAYHIPPDALVIRRFKDRLRKLAEDRTLDYDEGCVTSQWTSS